MIQLKISTYVFLAKIENLLLYPLKEFKIFQVRECNSISIISLSNYNISIEVSSTLKVQIVNIKLNPLIHLESGQTCIISGSNDFSNKTIYLSSAIAPNILFGYLIIIVIIVIIVIVSFWGAYNKLRRDKNKIDFDKWTAEGRVYLKDKKLS